MNAQAEVHGSRVRFDVGFGVEGGEECESKWVALFYAVIVIVAVAVAINVKE